MMDDILIFAETQKDHDLRLKKVLERLKKFNVSLNKEKCDINKKQVSFLGHIISADGIVVDPNKVEAILNFPDPSDKAEVRRLIGMVQYVSKFMVHSADLLRPLTQLLKENTEFVWTDVHRQALIKIKKALTSSPVLKPFDLNKETRLSADASSFALGAVLEQRLNESEPFHPVTYISRSLLSAERGYAQIEKEALAISWACERLDMYLKGLQFTILTDHKPLVSLLGKKPLHDLSPRILRFRLRLLAYDYTISHISGKKFFIPDCLSRVRDLQYGERDEDLCNTLEMSVQISAKQCSCVRYYNVRGKTTHLRRYRATECHKVSTKWMDYSMSLRSPTFFYNIF